MGQLTTLPPRGHGERRPVPMEIAVTGRSPLGSNIDVGTSSRPAS
jgi:hypothetical protein